MEAMGVAFIVTRTLLRWFTHPSVQEAHKAMDEGHVRAFLVQLERLLLDMERMFPGLPEQVIMTALLGAATHRQVVEVMREAGVTETQIALALGRT